MELYKGRYRSGSTRLKEWDYTTPGYYFIIFCTKNRQDFFGRVIKGDVHLSALGEIAQQFWLDIPNHCSITSLDEFVIMPNHVHGIVVIEEPPVETLPVETLHATSQRDSLSRKMSAISPKPGSISTIIRSYKSAVTRWARSNGYAEFAWQARFYDRFIRNEKTLNTIRKYIRNNPVNWEKLRAAQH